MWISSAKKNETKPPGFKPLGINLSYKHEKNDNLNLDLYKSKLFVKTKQKFSKDINSFASKVDKRKIVEVNGE